MGIRHSFQGRAAFCRARGLLNHAKTQATKPGGRIRPMKNQSSYFPLNFSPFVLSHRPQAFRIQDMPLRGSPRAAPCVRRVLTTNTSGQEYHYTASLLHRAFRFSLPQKPIRNHRAKVYRSASTAFCKRNAMQFSRFIYSSKK